VSILNAIDDKRFFGSTLGDPSSWWAWRDFLAAVFAFGMTDTEGELNRRRTTRADLPVPVFAEAWLVCGRRAGKWCVLDMIAVFLAAFRDYRPYLRPGERATITVIAADRRQARVIMRYVIAYRHSERDRSAIYLDALPLFASGRVRLLDVPRHASQFAALERRTSSLGRDRGDHGRSAGTQDDLCNSAALSLVMSTSTGAPTIISAEALRLARIPFYYVTSGERSSDVAPQKPASGPGLRSSQSVA